MEANEAGTIVGAFGKNACEWSGKEELSMKRTRCQTAEDKRDFVTVALMSVEHSVLYTDQKDGHRPKLRQLGSPDVSIHTRAEGTTVVCGDFIVAEIWVNGHFAVGQKYKEKTGRIQNGGRKKLRIPSHKSTTM